MLAQKVTWKLKLGQYVSMSHVKYQKMSEGNSCSGKDNLIQTVDWCAVMS